MKFLREIQILGAKRRFEHLQKKSFVDPSLACAALELSPTDLALDPKTFGFIFENFVLEI